ncbi:MULTISPECIES: 2-hydroxyacid dehydrogenase [Pseudomonas]|uniref:D-glycerate dehydrogenase n=2 Tax=Pseudomonas TaxID=286 RepID=A0AAW4BYY4_PSEPU|nr:MULTISPECIES: D-glycerate dehydrogenase [Pseudomonas]KKO17111.1 bifunctional glyoxylate/hydroxypyruvate reductase B [Pseudomonas putida KG-4]MBF8647700.1 D-glycerate dehydrogenase [Pseudomonas pudica]MBF8704200.1 D-glycerate dehydrogenase [Pseudomonas putida]MBF8710422.1 D-glycerate dehydrogenase [Pseudomonas putida]MBF8738416.1 D-glycerate dehydrogenase [Pseudomonas putida]
MQRVVSFGPISSAEVLADLGRRYHFQRFDQPLADRERFLAALATADGLIGSTLPLGAELLDRAPALKAIASVSAGFDNYDLAYLRKRGIRLTNTPDAVTEATADTGFMLLMMAARRAGELAQMVRDGEWTHAIDATRFGRDVHGKTLGIVGLGRIGAAVARRGHFGFGMQVLYSGNSDKPEYEAQFAARRVPLQQLLGEAHFVCVCVPLSPATHHLFGREQFAAMRADAVFVNIARGAVVDEAALVQALVEGQLGAAGLDVFEQEPLPAASPLLALPQVVALPHIGSATVEARALMARTAAAELAAVLEGRAPNHPVL